MVCGVFCWRTQGVSSEWDGWRAGDDKDTDSGQVGSSRRALAITLHDCAVRCVQRSGSHLVTDEDGEVVWIWDAQELDRLRRYKELKCEAIHDVFEQKMLWLRQMLTATFDAAGEWELVLHVEGGSAVVAYGSLEGDWAKTTAQDIPTFRVAQLPRLVQRVQAQIRLRKEYIHHLS